MRDFDGNLHANTGSVSNSLTVTANSPGNNGDVVDVSDDGIDNDGNTENERCDFLANECQEKSLKDDSFDTVYKM